jgi:VIT1/CCC1 family predicted Fe2+/Mn2+ transporter
VKTTALIASAGSGRQCWAPTTWLIPVVVIASLAFLALLGAIGARAGGADAVKGAVRVTFWGALAMAATAGIGALFGTVV